MFKSFRVVGMNQKVLAVKLCNIYTERPFVVLQKECIHNKKMYNLCRSKEDVLPTTQYYLTPLTLTQNQAIDDAMSGDDIDSLLADFKNVPVTTRSLHTLLPGKWLNDEVINFTIELFNERATKISSPTCYVMTTHFYNKLAGEDGNSFDYAQVKRWKKKQNLSEYDMIFVPIHSESEKHWTVAVINLKERRFEYYDSLLGHPGRILTNLQNYMKEKGINVDGWSHEPTSSVQPKQENGFDCGVFMLMTIDLRMRGMLIQNIKQADMPYYRRRIALQILTATLLD